MKYFLKICLVAIGAFSVLSAGASAQESFIIVDEKPQAFDDPQQAYKFTMKIYNQRDTAQPMRVTEYTDEVMPMDESYFCVGELCLPPSINEYETEVPELGTSDVYVYLKDNAKVNGTRRVRYVFANTNNLSDNIERTFTFVVGPTSVGENPNGVIATLSSPTPNPALESAIIQYSIPESTQGAIELYNANSELLKTFSLQNSSGSLIVPTAEFPAGMYLYALTIDGKKVATEKLVIAR